MNTQALSAAGLAALLTVSAIAHRIRPKFYYSVVPRSLCTDKDGRFGVMTREQWIAVTAVPEVAAAVGLLIPATRPTAAVATAVMFTGFTAAHLSGLSRALSRGSRRDRLVHTARLPLQAPLIAWAWSLRR